MTEEVVLQETPVIENMMTGPDLTGKTEPCPGCNNTGSHLDYCEPMGELVTNRTPTELYLDNRWKLGIPSHVRVWEKHNKHWPDGTRRLILQDLSKEDLLIYTRFADLCAFDKDGDYILELCIAFHDEYLEKRFAKQLAKWQRLVAYAPRNPVGRNEPCPCGAVKSGYGHIEGVGDNCFRMDIPVKYKNCHGHWSFVPEVTEEQAIEQVKELHELSESPDFQEVAKKFVAGELTANEMYEMMGVSDAAR